MIKVKVLRRCGDVKKGEIVDAIELYECYKIWHHTGVWAVSKKSVEEVIDKKEMETSDE